MQILHWWESIVHCLHTNPLWFIPLQPMETDQEKAEDQPKKEDTEKKDEKTEEVNEI